MGWIPDHPDNRDFMLSMTAAVGLPVPNQVDWSSKLPPCYDQGQLGSCTANAIAGAIEFVQQSEGEQFVMPSRLFIYYNERALEGSVESDSGAQIRDGIKSVAKKGFCTENLWPYDIRKFAVKPSERCYKAALKDRVTDYLRLDHDGPVPLLTCLASGYPFVFGFSVYESFEGTGGAQAGIVPRPGTDAAIGGHAVMAVGYDDSQQRFIVRNSWGPAWGLQGYCLMPYAYLTDTNLADDFWTIRVVETPTA